MRGFLFVVLLATELVSSVEPAYYGNYECGTYIHNGATLQRDVIVHLFDWKWNDIASECESFLGPKGFCAIQVSPPSEHITGGNGEWWQRYQPVSYKMTSRSGSSSEFDSMVNKCNNAGVRIYVDAVINHMTGGGSGTGTAGSSWSGDSYQYPGVPYGSGDFNNDICDRDISNYNDPYEVRDCRLVGLRDLALGADYVRGKVKAFMNDLISRGVSGFRVDACKHMWPGDLQAIFDGLNNIYSGQRPYIFQEVIDLGGEAIGSGEYTGLGRVTEFKYSSELGNVVRKWNGQRLAYLKNFGEGWGMMNAMQAVVFVDNHDNQRGHGAGGAAILTYKDSSKYKIATAFKLAYSYGHVRMMSSFKFSDTEAGPPSSSPCSSDWACEHRWRQMYNMVGFHNTALGQSVTNWWDNGYQAIAFGRGNKGFIVINNEDYTISENLYTGLPSGTYCDVISGEKSGSSCTGKSIQVDGSGYAYFSIAANTNNDALYDSFIAIHVNEKL